MECPDGLNSEAFGFSLNSGAFAFRPFSPSFFAPSGDFGVAVLVAGLLGVSLASAWAVASAFVSVAPSVDGVASPSAFFGTVGVPVGVPLPLACLFFF